MAFSPDNLSLFESIESGATAVVPDSASAGNLRRQYASWQASKGERLWDAPRFLSWSKWLNQCWDEYAGENNDQRIVLSRLQQRLVWSDVFDSDRKNIASRTILWNLSASVNQAIAAWHLVYDYQLEPCGWKDESTDAAVFARWQQAYDSRLKGNHWLDPAQLAGLLQMQGFAPQGGRLLVWGFNHPTPLQQQWLAHIEVQNTHSGIEWIDTPPAGRASAPVQAYVDYPQQLMACAQWARARLQAGQDRSIGIAVAELPANAQLIETIFQEVFTPDFNLPSGNSPAYEISTGQSLAVSPLIGAALNALALLETTFDYQVISHALLNPYLFENRCNQGELARQEAKLRKDARPVETLANLLVMLKGNAPGGSSVVNKLVDALEKLAGLRESLERYATPNTWCKVFSRALDIMGWPDFDHLDPSEQAELGNWDRLLSELCSSGLVNRRLSITRALGLLGEIAGETMLSSAPGARVTVFDINSARAARFNAAWVCDLSDAVLPQPIKFNPLIPISLQRQHCMPRHSAESCLQSGRDTFSGLLNLADDVRFSYFLTDEHTRYRPSPLIREFAHELEIGRVSTGFSRRQDIKPEIYSDMFGQAAEPGKVSGGAYLLKRQAECPFQAYAGKRLGADPLDYPQPGLDAKLKGNLIHRIMRGIWDELGGSQALQQLTEQARLELVNMHVNTQAGFLESAHPLFAGVERQRLARLIAAWLALELERPEFTVCETEFRSRINIDGFEFKLGIDRVDELEGGQWLLIDYKTGTAKASDWWSERIVDPQLPVYALALQDKTAGIAFARLKSLDFQGVAQSDLNIKGVSNVANPNKRSKLKDYEDWDALFDHWQQGVAVLVKEYRQGLASVSPVNEQVCTYCCRQSLCRLYD